MIRLRRIDIRNFVCFDHIVVTPSVDPDKSLTIIRAENGSGKTTFLRAIRWGMYGEQGLPGANTKTFSIHPADWRPNEEGIVTQVEIEFETDGSTRVHAATRDHTTVYNLTRRVTTILSPTTRDDLPDYQRVQETTLLMKKGPDGDWTPVPHPRMVIEELLPWGLRDFFVMDADKAADFVGGSENKAIARRDVIAKTTKAVQSLLGIDVFKDARQRVGGLEREFGAEATKAIGDRDLDALQRELDEHIRQKTGLEQDLAGQRRSRRELVDRRRRANHDLETEVKGVGGAEQLSQRLRQTRRRRKQAAVRYGRTLLRLSGQLESTSLLATLTKQLVEKAHGVLKPLHDSGAIPLRHLQFVRELLEEGACVCGQELSIDSTHRQHVEERVAKTADQERRAEYLEQLYDAAHALVRQGQVAEWLNRTGQLTEDSVSLGDELSELAREQREIEADLDLIDEDKIQMLRDEIDALQTQLNAVDRRIARNDLALPPIEQHILSLKKRIHQRTTKERAARDKKAAENLAGVVAKILTRAYRTIESEQVEELSQRMHLLFSQMAANVSDGDVANAEANKATLRMIAEVGVRSVDGAPGDYEICAFNGRGRLMPPIEINGASRRVLALSFVLALCKESRTYAPLIADSLLNFMSGAVRRNTLLATAENSSQPILLLTGADLEGQHEADITSRYGGATYTLTGQWDVVGEGGGGDVLNYTVRRQVAVVCECGPRQFCDVCERLGQRGSPGWGKREDGDRR
ncbi:MAG: AAA family ATPase [Gammaproteobacteria bacterium]|nr:AAA family ATPase [Gammaproteobacteria bacterium]MDE2716110.1 AAA family ATPase [Chloroflexota bacterium]